MRTLMERVLAPYEDLAERIGETSPRGYALRKIDAMDLSDFLALISEELDDMFKEIKGEQAS